MRFNRKTKVLQHLREQPRKQKGNGLHPGEVFTVYVLLKLENISHDELRRVKP